MGEGDVVRKIRMLSIMLSLCLIGGMSLGVQASSISVPAGSTEARISFSITSSKGDFAGMSFEVTPSSGLEYVTYSFGSIFSATGMPIFRELADGSFYFGIITSDNFYKMPANGRVDVCDLIFRYSGNSNQTVTVHDIQISRLIDKNHVDSEYLGPVTYQVERGAGGTGTDTNDNGGGAAPGDGSTNGDNNTAGGTTTTGGDAGGETSTSENITDTQRPGSATELSKIVYAPFISGYPDGTVQPDGQLSRAELAQIIFNLFGSGNNNTADYSDMDQSHWAYNAIGFCQTEGYMLGYPEGTFMPEQTVTRAELSTALVRIKDLGLNANHPFTDVGDHWGKEFIGAAFAGGLVLGYPDGTFQPDNPVTRAEAVTMICRAEERDETLYDTTKTFSDLAASFWGYDYIMNAANGYNYAG